MTATKSRGRRTFRFHGGCRPRTACHTGREWSGTLQYSSSHAPPCILRNSRLPTQHSHHHTLLPPFADHHRRSGCTPRGMPHCCSPAGTSIQPRPHRSKNSRPHPPDSRRRTAQSPLESFDRPRSACTSLGAGGSPLHRSSEARPCSLHCTRHPKPCSHHHRPHPGSECHPHTERSTHLADWAWP